MYNPQLETFIRVADAGSFNKAAEELYITSPAVIKQINLLEQNLGLTLFIRTHRGLILTKSGKSLYNDAKYVIQYCHEAIERARKAVEDNFSVVRIGTSPMTPAQVFMDLWPKIHELCSDIKFQVVPFTNTPENAREILKNLGQNIELVAGIFDDTMLNLRGCAGMELTREQICCAVSLTHRLAGKSAIDVKDLYGENLMLMHRGWSHYVDELRNDLEQNHPKIKIVDFDFYNLSVFNQCENSNNILMAVKNWQGVHPLLKIIPVKWQHTIPYGLLYSHQPSETVQRILKAVQSLQKNK